MLTSVSLDFFKHDLRCWFSSHKVMKLRELHTLHRTVTWSVVSFVDIDCVVVQIAVCWFDKLEFTKEVILLYKYFSSVNN